MLQQQEALAAQTHTGAHQALKQAVTQSDCRAALHAAAGLQQRTQQVRQAMAATAAAPCRLHLCRQRIPRPSGSLSSGTQLLQQRAGAPTGGGRETDRMEQAKT